MNYYSFHVGDYRRDTTYLSPEEHYIYRTLIDWYFLDEMPIPLDNQTISRRLNLKSEWLSPLNNVLNDFFEKTDSGYVHHRIEYDIREYKDKIELCSKAGKLGGRPKIKRPLNGRKASVKATKNQEPRTINHSYKESTKENTKATRLDNTISLDVLSHWKDFALKERPDWTEKKVHDVFDSFKDYWKSKPKDNTRLNWLATWRNWVRNDKNFNKPTNGRNKKFNAFTHIQDKENGQRNEKEITGVVVETTRGQCITDGSAGTKI